MILTRLARSEDVPRLMEIAGHSPAAARWSEPAYAKLFAPDAAGLVSLVIEEDGQPVGFLVGRSVDAQGDREWEIENLAVSGPAQRRGLGSRLLSEFLSLVHRRGGREIFLEVRESNQAARKLYEKWAFVEAGRRKAYYHDPTEDALVLKFSTAGSGQVCQYPDNSGTLKLS